MSVSGVQQSYSVLSISIYRMGFPGGSDGKVSVCNAGDPGSIPGLGRSPGEGNSSPLQYSCLENPMDSRTWKGTTHGVAKSRTRLSEGKIKKKIISLGSHLTPSSLFSSPCNSVNLSGCPSLWRNFSSLA